LAETAFTVDAEQALAQLSPLWPKSSVFPEGASVPTALVLRNFLQACTWPTVSYFVSIFVFSAALNPSVFYRTVRIRYLPQEFLPIAPWVAPATPTITLADIVSTGWGIVGIVISPFCSLKWCFLPSCSSGQGARIVRSNQSIIQKGYD